MAVWSASKDHTAFALAVLLLASIFLPAVCSSQEPGQWWSDPCDRLRKARHHVGTHKVHTQLNNVIADLNRNQFPKLRQIFKTAMPHSLPIANYSWLNFANFKKAMKKHKNKDYALVEFHKALQIYGGTFYMLNETEIVSKAADAEKASSLLENVAYELKRLTCEVVHELDEKNIKSNILTLKEMNIQLSREMTFTNAHVEYVRILKSYRMFLKRSRNILFGKGKKRKPGKKPMKKPKNRSKKQ